VICIEQTSITPQFILKVGVLMNEELNERWGQLCQLSLVEPDSERFMKLVEEVHLMLDVRHAEITALRRGEKSDYVLIL
jgi:hypothetical protein